MQTVCEWSVASLSHNLNSWLSCLTSIILLNQNYNLKYNFPLVFIFKYHTFYEKYMKRTMFRTTSLATLNFSKGHKQMWPFDNSMNVFNACTKFLVYWRSHGKLIKLSELLFCVLFVKLRILICCSNNSTLDYTFRLCIFERLMLFLRYPSFIVLQS